VIVSFRSSGEHCALAGVRVFEVALHLQGVVASGGAAASRAVQGGRKGAGARSARGYVRERPDRMMRGML